MSLSPDIEQPIIQERRPLSPGHRLLFPNPGFLIGGASKMTLDEMGLIEAPLSRLNSKLLKRNLGILAEEYFSLLGTIRDHVGKENITLVRNRVLMKHDDPQTLRDFFSSTEFPDFEGFESVSFEMSEDNPTKDHHTIWTRDDFTTIGNITFLNPFYFPNFQESETVIKSSLGEGGTVLAAGNAVLINEDLWRIRNQDRGFEILRNLGFTIAPLPAVNQSKQRYSWFVESHVDGHAALILDANEKPHLLVAESYSRQGDSTRKKIRFAADTIGAQVFEIDDSTLPPLALNLIQFADKTVVVTGSETADLTFVLDQLLGEEKVLITSVPLIGIPAILAGSIRCMTNILPANLLKKLEAQS